MQSNFRNLLFLFLGLFFLVGCASKSPVVIEGDEIVALQESQKNVEVHFKNQSKENINFIFEIKRGLIAKGYKIDDEIIEKGYLLDIEVLSVTQLEKKSTMNEVLSHVDLNIGLGGSIGNVGISTKVGTQIGKLFATGTTEILQVVIDILVTIDTKKTKHIQLVAIGNLDEVKKTELLLILEKELSKKILELF